MLNKIFDILNDCGWIIGTNGDSVCATFYGGDEWFDEWSVRFNIDDDLSEVATTFGDEYNHFTIQEYASELMRRAIDLAIRNEIGRNEYPTDWEFESAYHTIRSNIEEAANALDDALETACA